VNRESTSCSFRKSVIETSSFVSKLDSNCREMLISGDSIRKNHIWHDQTNLLKYTLALLTITGCWRPLSWISSYKYKLYNVYTLLLVLLLYTFAISQFMAIVLNAANPDEFTSVLYMMMTVCVSIFKISSMWLNHRNLADIINTLTDIPFRPVIADEIKIRQNFDKIIR